MDKTNNHYNNEESKSIEVVTTTELEESIEIMLQVKANELSLNELESQPIEMGKTVAISSKTMQLRFVYDNGRGKCSYDLSVQ